MINCSIHNYKEWIEAYIEASLNAEDMHAAEVFLQQHPTLLDTYLDELEEFSLEPENVELYSKDQLQIVITPTPHIHQNNFTEYFIGNIEGLLSSAEQTELQSFLSINPALKNEFDIYASTKLLADPSIQYPYKKDLIKRSRPAVPFYWPMSAAVAILLLVGVWVLWPSDSSNASAFISTHRIEINKTAIKNNAPEINNNQFTNNHLNPQKELIKNSEGPKAHQERSTPVEMVSVKTVQVHENINPQRTVELALQPIPSIEHSEPAIQEELAENGPRKKGLFNKIFSGDQTYIEDYVNATFSVFKNNQEEDKWVLKVDRDENGKSKRVKFTSPIFSAKSRN